MNPSPAAIEYVRAQNPDWAQADAAIAVALNGATVANPIATAPTVRKPFTVNQAFGQLSPASAAKLMAIAFLPDVRDKIAANDLAGCQLYIALLTAGGAIQPSEAQALAALVAATQNDPSWSPQVPAPLVAIGRVLDAEDIAASRPGA